MQPTAISIKEKLHQTIDSIDDEKVLEAFYTILGSYRNEAENYELTDEQLKELEKRISCIDCLNDWFILDGIQRITFALSYVNLLSSRLTL